MPSLYTAVTHSINMASISPFPGLAESAFNRYLALDPEMSTQLAELEGRCLCFHLTQPEWIVYVQPHDKAVSLSPHWDTEPDCTIKASAINLLKMMRSDDPAQSLSSGEVEITGDSRLAQRFSDILKQVEIDWEELASKVIGDFAAHRLGNVGRQVKNWFDETLTALRLDGSEYLREESGILPTRTEIDQFLDQVDDFRSDVDRLEARIKRLEQRLTASAS